MNGAIGSYLPSFEWSYGLVFLLGIVADLLRRIIMPRTQDWIEGFIPSERRSRNAEKNLQLLETAQRLESLGVPVEMADQIELDAQTFSRALRKRVEAEQRAYTESSSSMVEHFAVTQAEMNDISLARFEAAEKLMDARFRVLMADEALTTNARDVLKNAQASFSQFRRHDSEAEAILTAEGGTMQPMVTTSSMERITIARLARLEELGELV